MNVWVNNKKANHEENGKQKPDNVEELQKKEEKKQVLED